MGLEALPYQTTVFPIQMNGWAYDYMLAIDNDNCPTRGAQEDTITDKIVADADEIAQRDMPDFKKYLDGYGWSDLCNYVSWAYTESVELTIPLDIKEMFDVCNTIRKNETQQFFDLDQSNVLESVTTFELRKNLKNQVDSWLQVPTTVGQSSAEKTLEGTAGSEHPKYVMLFTNEKLLSQIALSLSGNGTFEHMLPLSPSSTIVLEFTQETPTDDLMVRAFVNDQLVDTFGCMLQNSCKAADFSKLLGIELEKAEDLDVKKFCGDPFAPFANKRQ